MPTGRQWFTGIAAATVMTVGGLGVGSDQWHKYQRRASQEAHQAWSANNVKIYGSKVDEMFAATRAREEGFVKSANDVFAKGEVFFLSVYKEWLLNADQKFHEVLKTIDKKEPVTLQMMEQLWILKEEGRFLGSVMHNLETDRETLKKSGKLLGVNHFDPDGFVPVSAMASAAKRAADATVEAWKVYDGFSEADRKKYHDYDRKERADKISDLFPEGVQAGASGWKVLLELNEKFSGLLVLHPQHYNPIITDLDFPAAHHSHAYYAGRIKAMFQKHFPDNGFGQRIRDYSSLESPVRFASGGRRVSANVTFGGLNT